MSTLAATFAIVLLCGSALLLVEVIAGVHRIARHERTADDMTLPITVGTPSAPPLRVAVLIPAHNEAIILADTLAALAPARTEHTELLVVADNCTDETAKLARDVGVPVVERTDANRRGKGHALAFGIAALAANPPDIVIVLDADCIVSSDDLQLMAKSAASTNCPVQSQYIMALPHPTQATPRQRLAAFAWWLKVTVRQCGLHHLSQTCHLSGSGMAFPWSVISSMPLGTSHIVEDLVLGLWLARQRQRVNYCYAAVVRSTFPSAERDATDQRTRWETGHIRSITQEVPATILRALMQRNSSALALAIDAAIPPLALFALLFAMNLLMSIGIWLAGGSGIAFAITAIGLFIMACSIAIAAHSDLEKRLKITDIMASIKYMASKVSLYRRVLQGDPVDWIKTKRN